MAFPFFYINEYDEAQKEIVLNEETSKHIVQVLRMQEGEKTNLTDGKGNLVTAEIVDPHKKHCSVKVIDSRFTPDGYRDHASRKVTIAISLLKNTNRFEWFLEKATEIGVSAIIPLICERTEKEKFRYDRMLGICISAMLQSEQVWLPVLHKPVEFLKEVSQSNAEQKFIAHCMLGVKQSLSNFPTSQFQNSQMLIGPEGDFTKEEIELALQKSFIPVSLGDTRLRTETAGVVAATLLCGC